MVHMKRNASHAGFTLVELSIVLVILALIAGGVLVGKSLLDGAKVRSTLGDIEVFNSAVATFTNKYAALPGDMSDATDMWGANGACPIADDTRKTATCNGNGDNAISSSTMGVNGFELYTFWQHLANAQLIEGKYSGFENSTTNGVPYNALDTFFRLWYCPPSASNLCDVAVVTLSQWFDADYYYMLEATNTAGTGITPVVAQQIDDKVDDGSPALGSVLGAPRPDYMFIGSNPPCATTAVAATAAYNVSINTKSCSLLFLKQFDLK